MHDYDEIAPIIGYGRSYLYYGIVLLLAAPFAVYGGFAALGCIVGLFGLLAFCTGLGVRLRRMWGYHLLLFRLRLGVFGPVSAPFLSRALYR